MITPSYSLTANTRVVPKLALDFTTASLDSRITLTRSTNNATAINSSGNIAVVNANLPRFDYDPSTLVCKGILVEESRKNILLNSLVNGTNLSTQSVTSSAVAYTLSFYGTGSIDLTGTHTATVTGTAAYPTRKTYTFTPTAGTLTLTVSGTVQYAQLEAGAFASTFIPTDSTAGGLTRSADNLTMTGTNFSDWYNTSEGSFVAWADTFAINQTAQTTIINTGVATGNPSLYLRSASDRINAGLVNVFGINAAGGAVTANTAFKTSYGYKASNHALYVNTTAAGTSTNATAPASATTCYIGNQNSTLYWNGHLAKIFFYPQRLTNAELQAFSK